MANPVFREDALRQLHLPFRLRELSDDGTADDHYKWANHTIPFCWRIVRAKNR